MPAKNSVCRRKISCLGKYASYAPEASWPWVVLLPFLSRVEGRQCLQRTSATSRCGQSGAANRMGRSLGMGELFLRRHVVRSDGADPLPEAVQSPAPVAGAEPLGIPEHLGPAPEGSASPNNNRMQYVDLVTRGKILRLRRGVDSEAGTLSRKQREKHGAHGRGTLTTAALARSIPCGPGFLDLQLRHFPRTLDPLC